MTPTPDEKHPHIQHYADGTASVMRKVVVYTELRFYKRSDVLYQLTQVFCQRYLPRYGDRTVDQMVQAARSTKQNIAEGSTDGQTSTETELKLLGIARGSNQELLEDYQDYLKRKGMTEWFGKNDRFDRLHRFCQEHTRWDDYRPLTERMNDEELANMAICLCHQVDKAMTKYIEQRPRVHHRRWYPRAHDRSKAQPARDPAPDHRAPGRRNSCPPQGARPAAHAAGGARIMRPPESPESPETPENPENPGTQ